MGLPRLNGVAISCRSHARVIPGSSASLPDRIAAKIVTRERHACWRWAGGTSRKRDGALRPKIQIGGRGGRVASVARVILALWDGVSLKRRVGLEAGHTCHHYWCVNPLHLYWCSRQENEDDKRRVSVFHATEAEIQDMADRLSMW